MGRYSTKNIRTESVILLPTPIPLPTYLRYGPNPNLPMVSTVLLYLEIAIKLPQMIFTTNYHKLLYPSNFYRPRIYIRHRQL